MKRFTKLFAVVAVILFLAGCSRSRPIAEVHSSVGTGFTQQQVKSAILKAGAKRQWIMSEMGPGVINARQQSRDHVAEVRITYSSSSYDIIYSSSLNLNASGGMIHKNYNRWVLNLNNEIQRNLSVTAAM